MTTVETLRAARALLVNPANWKKGGGLQVAAPRCVGNTICFVRGRTEHDDATQAIQRALVLAAFDRAIAAEEAREQEFAVALRAVRRERGRVHAAAVAAGCAERDGGMSATQTYRKSRVGVYPLDFGWAWQVVAPDGTRISSTGPTEALAKKAARREARFRDRLERDRVDGVVEKRTDRVLERGVRVCEKCGKTHDLVAITRRGRRWGQTWASPDCGSYHPESWEALSRRLLSERAAA